MQWKVGIRNNDFFIGLFIFFQIILILIVSSKLCFREDWKERFPERNLKALSVNPLIINPIKYTNDIGYISDTEDSSIIKTDSLSKDEL